MKIAGVARPGWPSFGRATAPPREPWAKMDVETDQLGLKKRSAGARGRARACNGPARSGPEPPGTRSALATLGGSTSKAPVCQAMCEETALQPLWPVSQHGLYMKPACTAKIVA